MRLRIKNPQDFWCGLFFIGLGALAVYLARRYELGSALYMGPGYFPTWLGGLLVAFGVAMVAMAFKFETRPDEASQEPWAFRPWLLLPAAIIVFALLMEAEVGFVPSLLVLIVGCAAAHKDMHWRETILLSLFVTAGAVAIFSYGLELPYRLFWWSD